MTKKRMLAMAGVLGGLLGASGARAAISGSSHDFTATGPNPIAGVTEICVTCHVPHRPLQNVPLWAHALTAGSYNLYNSNASYSSGNSSHYDASPQAFTGSQSRACLSCHDGTLAVSGGVFITTADPVWILWDAGAAVAAGGAAGLKGSHPVAVDYSTLLAANPTEYNAVATLAPVLLENSKVQCTSCHNAHNKFPKMLVMSNAGSALCLKCHNK